MVLKQRKTSVNLLSQVVLQTKSMQTRDRITLWSHNTKRGRQHLHGIRVFRQIKGHMLNGRVHGLLMQWQTGTRMGRQHLHGISLFRQIMGHMLNGRVHGLLIRWQTRTLHNRQQQSTIGMFAQVASMNKVNQRGRQSQACSMLARHYRRVKVALLKRCLKQMRDQAVASAHLKRASQQSKFTRWLLNKEHESTHEQLQTLEWEMQRRGASARNASKKHQILDIRAKKAAVRLLWKRLMRESHRKTETKCLLSLASWRESSHENRFRCESYTRGVLSSVGLASAHVTWASETLCLRQTFGRANLTSVQLERQSKEADAAEEMNRTKREVAAKEKVIVVLHKELRQLKWQHDSANDLLKLSQGGDTASLTLELIAVKSENAKLHEQIMTVNQQSDREAELIEKMMEADARRQTMQQDLNAEREKTRELMQELKIVKRLL